MFLDAKIEEVPGYTLSALHDQESSLGPNPIVSAGGICMRHQGWFTDLGCFTME